MKKSFPAELDKLYDMLDYGPCKQSWQGLTRHSSIKSNLLLKRCLSILLATVTPIFTVSSPTPGTIDISCTFSEEAGMKITIQDYGIPYNPLKTAIDPD